MLQIISTFTGVTLAEADEARRALGAPDGQPEVEVWLRPLAYGRGYDVATVDKVWEVLKAFASFGFCKAHAAAFALPTYQSAWLKTHHPGWSYTVLEPGCYLWHSPHGYQFLRDHTGTTDVTRARPPDS